MEAYVHPYGCDSDRAMWEPYYEGWTVDDDDYEEEEDGEPEDDE